jgi:hypothetical protein
MQRYTLFYRGGTLPAGDVQKIRSTPGVRVIDDELARALLVEAEEPAIEALRRALPDWRIGHEVFYSRPKPQ